MTGCASGNSGETVDGGSRRDSGAETSDTGTTPGDDSGLSDAGGTPLIDAGGTEATDAGNIDAGSSDAGWATDAGGATCTGTPWGTVPHGFSGTAYQAAMPAGQCISQTRTCTNGTMSGSYTNLACTAGCTGTPWGNVASGFSVTAYRDAIAPFGSTCAGSSQTRTCTNGTMSGSYTNMSCIQYPCEFAGIHFRVGSAGFTAPTVPAQFASCQEDGTWSAWMNGNPSGVGETCEWMTAEGTVYVESRTCGFERSTGRRYRCLNGDIIDGSTACPAGP
jgi:hypothetical protein